ncbi:hypothetical protein HNR46_000300 [Haloferula luteola]|uniref:DUF2383 domain-containing protein n=1 Tax=Haloferula luteola TaxID=595692 RepID=A0A840V8H0_9BACT|nr:DUF2383 domain-containing protein [Haloferula luteola]MBB5350079.1 hypothetical protein [Haloferula luteola]
MNTTLHTECIEVCNQLLRGEISAVETYGQAIEKFAGEPEVGTLRRVQDEHRESVAKLKANILEMGGVPESNSGAWGTFAKGVEATAKLFGEASAVAALRQGEEFGIGLYEAAIENDDVMPECKSLIRMQLLPKLRTHLVTLSALEG